MKGSFFTLMVLMAVIISPYKGGAVSFSIGWQSPTPGGTGIVAVLGAASADFNGDNNLDFVICSVGLPYAAYVYLSDGVGGFVQQPVVNLNLQRVDDILALDVNGDGNVDIVVGPIGALSTAFLGDGTGAFPSTIAYKAVTSAVNFAAVDDFNGDKIADVIMAQSTMSGLWLQLGNPNKTLQAMVNVPVAGIPAKLIAPALVSGDFDGDGKVDVLLFDNSGFVKLNSNTIYMLLNTTPAPGGITPALGGTTPTTGGAAPALLMLSMGDVNGNGSGDFAVLGKRKSTGRYVIRVKDSLMIPHLIREIGLNGAYKPVQMVKLPDVNGNGSPEIAVLEIDPVTGLNRQIQVKDSRTGAKIVNILLKPSVKPHMLIALPDVNGNGSADLALSEVDAITGKNVQIQVKDGRTGALITNIRVSTSVKPHMLVSLGLINGKPALALSEVHATTGKNVQIQVKNAFTGAKIVNIRVKASVKPHMLVVLSDVNGNGSPDLALSEVDAVTGKNVQIQVKDGKTGALIRNVRVNTSVKPHVLLALPDLNANGSPELALSEVHAVSGKNVQIQVKDGRTGQLIRNIQINRSVTPAQMVVVSDVNGNGSPELALSEVDAVTGKNVQIQVKDALTGKKIRNIQLNPNYVPLSMRRTRNSNGNGTQELGVLEQNTAGTVQIQVKDPLTGAKVVNLAFPKF